MSSHIQAEIDYRGKQVVRVVILGRDKRGTVARADFCGLSDLWHGRKDSAKSFKLVIGFALTIALTIVINTTPCAALTDGFYVLPTCG